MNGDPGGYARFFGTPTVELHGQEYELPVQKSSAVLTYLALRDGWIDRDELLYVFYPDSPEGSARGSLRQLLTSIRRLPYSSGLAIENRRLRWNVRTDVHAFRQAFEERRWDLALTFFEQPPFAGFRVAGIPDFEAWLDAEQASLLSMRREATFALADVLAATDRSTQASELLARLHVALPFDEEVVQKYLTSLCRSKSADKALAVFDAFSRSLQREYGDLPSAVTTQIVDSARRGDTALVAESPIAGVSLRGGSDAQPLHNLPRSMTSLIGREREVRSLASRLEHPTCRLLTITGPGGVGKSRLALEVAETLLDGFRDGVYLVPLASITDHELVVFKIAEAVGFTFYGKEPAGSQLASYLIDKQVLLLVDNVEHVLEAAHLVRDLLASCGRLKILATSRTPLQLYGEWQHETQPLTLPTEASMDPQSALASEAIRLFVDRATAADSTFELTTENVRTVSKICVRLEGLPLALELAAARAHALPTEMLLAKLEDRFALLTTTTRDLPARQQSLRGAVDWSYNLLAARQQRVFRRLAVFRGGFTREAVAHVAAMAGDRVEEDVTVLVDHCLVKRMSDSDHVRFGMLETLRDYALEKLAASGELADAQTRHVRYYLNEAERMAAELVTARRLDEAFHWFDRERNNWRQALRWALQDDGDSAVRLGMALAAYWDRHPELEGLAWLEEVIAHPAATESARARLRLASGLLTDLCRGDVPEATRLVEDSLQHARHAGDTLTAVWAIPRLILVDLQQSNLARAKELAEEGIRLARELAFPSELAHMLTRAGVVSLTEGNRSEATARFEEARYVADSAGHTTNEFWARYYLAGLSLLDGDIPAARRLTDRIRSIVDQAPTIDNTHPFEALGRTELADGRPENAAALFTVALSFFRDAGVKPCSAHALEAFARLALAREQPDRAARLLGAALGVLDTHDMVMLPLEQAQLEQTMSAVGAKLDAQGLETALMHGKDMSLTDAIEFALAGSDSRFMACELPIFDARQSRTPLSRPGGRRKSIES